MRLLRLIVALLLLLAPGSALAGQSALEAIEADRQAGTLDDDAALLQTFYATLRPEALDAPYAGLPVGDLPPCATTLVSDVRGAWDRLTGAERHVVALTTDPFYRAWVDRGGMTWEEGDVDAARGEERSTCFSPEEALPQGGPYDAIHETEHFVIHYDEIGSVNETRINWLGDYFEDSLQVEHVDMGFYLPANMTVYQMLVIVERLPSQGIGGFTSAANCGLSGYMPFVVLNSQWFDFPTEWVRSAAAHEFFHSIQMEYGAGELFFVAEQSPNRWWVEASAVFMETEVYPELYGSQFGQAARWFTEPWRRLETYDDGGYQYGTFLFPASVRQSLEESEWFHDLWTQIEGRSGYDLIEEFDELLQDRGTTFLDEYGLMIERAATGDFPFNPYLALDADEIEVETIEDHDEDDLPLAESVNSDSGHDRPEYLGTNYVWFDGDGIGDDQALWITFDGSGSKNSVDLQWEVRLVAVRNEEPRLTWDLPLTAVYDGDELASWFGQVLVNDFGEDFDGVYLAASPVADFGEGGVTWSYTAELTDSIADGSFTDVPEELIEDPDDGDGCACASGTQRGAGPALLMLPAAGLLLTRRRARQRSSGRLYYPVA